MHPSFAIADDLMEQTQLAVPLIVGRCNWLQDAARQFQAIRHLPEGWDGDGAALPDNVALETAWSLLVSLCTAADLPKPHVNPTRAGGVQFEWDGGDRYFEIEIDTHRVINYFFRDDQRRNEESGDIAIGQPLDRLIAYIQRVATNTPA